MSSPPCNMHSITPNKQIHSWTPVEELHFRSRNEQYMSQAPISASEHTVNKLSCKRDSMCFCLKLYEFVTPISESEKISGDKHTVNKLGCKHTSM